MILFLFIKYIHKMDGSIGQGVGVALISGSGLFAGDRIILTSGARSWRIRIPSSQESESNTLLIEYKSGARWFLGTSYDLDN